MKKTAKAHPNLAFIKYWGKSDENIRLPLNSSISMNLSNLHTVTTVEFNKNFPKDQVIVDNKQNDLVTDRVVKHLDRIRNIAKVSTKAKVVSQNNFPQSTGLSSSASAYASLTLACCSALELKLNESELSIIARLGSGSACRSIPDGFVEWRKSQDSQKSFAYSLYKPSWWRIVDVVVLTDSKKKLVSSTEGQSRWQTSPFMKTRLKNIVTKIKDLKDCLQRKDFLSFGEIVEEEALELHAIMFTSKPRLIYISPETIQLIQQVNQWRQEGLSVFFSLNTGQDVHLLCEENNLDKLILKLNKYHNFKKYIINKPSEGARIINNHLF